MVHEPKFTAELLASLLAIPPNKTLLRRHLSTHFQELVGRDKISEKRQTEANSGYIPLTATAKLKVFNLIPLFCENKILIPFYRAANKKGPIHPEEEETEGRDGAGRSGVSPGRLREQCR